MTCSQDNYFYRPFKSDRLLGEQTEIWDSQYHSEYIESYSTIANINFKDSVICDLKPIVFKLPTEYNYQLNGNSINPNFSISKPGVYDLLITSSCSQIMLTANIINISSPILEIDNTHTLNCALNPITIKPITHQGSLLWSTGDNSDEIELSTPGEYWVKATNNCDEVMRTFEVIINISLPILEIDNTHTLNCILTPLTVKPITHQGSLLWSTGDNSDEIELSTPGEYWVKATNNCGEIMRTFEVITKSAQKVELPNIITPNKDGKNDFLAFNQELINISLSVYNRWGRKVYFEKNYKNIWDANNISSGTYYYTIHNQCTDEIYNSVLHVLK